jgi:hypothetical protein
MSARSSESEESVGTSGAAARTSILNPDGEGRKPGDPDTDDEIEAEYREEQAIVQAKRKKNREELKRARGMGARLVVTAIEYPRIDSIDQPTLIEWKKKREEYERKLKEEAKISGGDWQTTAYTWMASTRTEFLDSLCKWTWKIDREDLTEESYQERLKTIMRTPTTKWHPTTADLKMYFSELRLAPSTKGTVADRHVKYMYRIEEIIKKNAIQDIVSTKEMTKALIRVVTDRLDPRELRYAVEDATQLKKVHSLMDFSDVLLEQMDRREESDELARQTRELEKKRTREEDHRDGPLSKRARKNQKWIDDGKKPRIGHGEAKGWGNPPKQALPVRSGGWSTADRSASRSSSSDNNWGARADSKAKAKEEARRDATRRNTEDNQQRSKYGTEKKVSFKPGTNSSGEEVCFVCQQPGHRARDCENKEDSERAKKGRNAIRRFKYRENLKKKKSLKVNQA